MRRRENLVDLEKSEKMRLLSLSYLSIQPRTSPVKFARSPCTDPSGFGSGASSFFVWLLHSRDFMRVMLRLHIFTEVGKKYRIVRDLQCKVIE